MRRVAVTGLGAVSPFGVGVKAYWNGLSAGVCAIRPVTLVETEGFRCRIAAEVPDGVGGSPRRTRADRFALAAAREALEDAGLSRDERAEAALVVGAVGGGMLEAEAWYWERFRGRRPASRRTPRSTLPFSHADVVGNVLGLAGPRETLVTACSSGAASRRSAAESRASSSASRAAVSASRSARARRADPPIVPGTSAAMRERNPSVSISVMGRIAHAPAVIPCQNALTPAPKGLTAPSPVTTTVRPRRPLTAGSPAPR